MDGIAGYHRQQTEEGFHTHRRKKGEQGRFAASLAPSSERFSARISGATNIVSEVDATPSTPAPADMRADALYSPLIFENSNAFSLMGGRHRFVLEDICRLKEEDQVLVIISKLASTVKYNEYISSFVNKYGALFRRAGASFVQRPATVARNPKGRDFLLGAVGDQ